MQSINVSIPEPCQENWDAMQEAEKGRFCLSCQKTVVDFTVMTDQEMLQFFRQSDSIPCGRFAADQLNRTIALPPPQRFRSRCFFYFLLPAFLLTQRATAHTTMDRYNKNLPVASAPFLNHYAKELPGGTVLRGKITDSISGQPIAFAMVKIKGLPITAKTDSNGLFTLTRVPNAKDIVLQISCPGYQKAKVTVKDLHQVINIRLQPLIYEMNDVVVVAYPPVKHYSGIPSSYRVIAVDRKHDTILEKIADTLTGKNKITVTYAPLPEGIIYLDMKRVQKGDCLIRLLDAAGHLLQYHTITIPAKDFTFEWQVGNKLAAGTYTVHISNGVGKTLCKSKIMVTQ